MAVLYSIALSVHGSIEDSESSCWCRRQGPPSSADDLRRYADSSQWGILRRRAFRRLGSLRHGEQSRREVQSAFRHHAAAPHASPFHPDPLRHLRHVVSRRLQAAEGTWTLSFLSAFWKASSRCRNWLRIRRQELLPISSSVVAPHAEPVQNFHGKHSIWSLGGGRLLADERALLFVHWREDSILPSSRSERRL